jgi:predicted alpha/beta hydrolase
MACGTGVTKEPGADPFAPRVQAAGFSVLAFDFRRLGASGGTPRQLVRVDDQVADYGAAIGFARTLPEVEPPRVAIWGFSLAGGHVLRVAAAHPELAAAIAQAPLADGLAISPNAMRSMSAGAAMRLQLAAAADLLGRWLLRRPPRVVYDGDRTVLTGPPARAAQRAPRGEVVHLPGDHYAAFADARDATLDAEIAFLSRHLVSAAGLEPVRARAA